MNYWDKRVETYGAAAVGFAGTQKEREEADAAFLKAFEKVEPCDVLVDFGCGVGRLYPILSSKCKQYVGVDSSRKMLDMFNQIQPRRAADVLVERSGDDGQIPLGDNSADAVVCSVVLQHILDPSTFLFTVNELKRILKRGGQLYLCEAMTEGIVAKQPCPDKQRLRPQEMYGYVFSPEIPLQEIVDVWNIHKLLTGIKRDVFIDDSKIVVDIGCGRNKVFNALGLDNRVSFCYGERVTNLVADANYPLPFRDKVVDHVYLNNVLEHFTNPYPILFEVYRILKDDGVATIEVPYPGTASSDGDASHKMVLSPDQWVLILNGFFSKIRVSPLGHRFRGVTTRWHKWQSKLMSLGFWEMAQGGRFNCSLPNQVVEFRYVPWWLEEYVRHMVGGDLL
jgi:ubiquinone/menaquinone biosynthesis C-methylase UbiE